MVALSVIMPAYNEEASIEAAVADVFRHVLPVVGDGELVVIDDGSTDRTGALLDAMAATEPRLRVVHQPNAGHGPALVRGITEARGEAILLLDSDRQIALDDFARHWARMTQENLVAFLGLRRPRHDAFHRLVISALMRLLILLCFGRAPQDAGAPYKIVRRAEAEAARRFIGEDCWIPSVLLAVYLLVRHRDRVVEAGVTHRPRVAGTSVLNLARLVTFCRSAALDVLRFRSALRSGPR